MCCDWKLFAEMHLLHSGQKRRPGTVRPPAREVVDLAAVWQTPPVPGSTNQRMRRDLSCTRTK